MPHPSTFLGRPDRDLVHGGGGGAVSERGRCVSTDEEPETDEEPNNQDDSQDEYEGGEAGGARSGVDSSDGVVYAEVGEGDWSYEGDSEDSDDMGSACIDNITDEELEGSSDAGDELPPHHFPIKPKYPANDVFSESEESDGTE